MNWQLLYERSEMLRQFQQQLWLEMSHQLRSPAAKQATTLTLILEGWCESPQEERQHLQHLQTALHQWQLHWQTLEDLLATPLPVQPLQLQPLPLASPWPVVARLITPLAEDRRIAITFPQLSSPQPLISGDPQACIELGLGVSYWGLQQLVQGQIQILPAQNSILWQIQGSRLPVQETLFWQVPRRLAEVMGGQLSYQEQGNILQVAWIPHPWDNLESNS
ncbi:MAG: hypothetical protein Q6K99_09515 [Thermostichales cyanobacterium BF4_bins_65]